MSPKIMDYGLFVNLFLLFRFILICEIFDEFILEEIVVTAHKVDSVQYEFKPAPVEVEASIYVKFILK